MKQDVARTGGRRSGNLETSRYRDCRSREREEVIPIRLRVQTVDDRFSHMGGGVLFQRSRDSLALIRS